MRRDPGGWQTRLDAATVARRRADGTWRNVTLADQLDALCAEDAERILVIDGARTMAVGTVRAEAQRLAQALARRGLKAGEVVSFQLPNWHEAVLIEVACAYGGFVCNPIVPIYRDAEVGFIIADAGSRILFVPHVFRNFDYVAMTTRLWPSRPKLDDVIVVRSDTAGAGTPFSALLAEADGAAALARPDPNHVKLIMYTSGTTSRPKGVLHTHNTIDAEIRNVVDWFGLDARDVILMPSPLTHITGYLYGIQLPIALGCPVILMDAWDVARAADLVDEHRVTFTLGATPFLQELGRFARDHGRPLPSLRYFPTGGAPVPPEVIRNARKAFARCLSFRLYGSTEAPTVTLGVPEPGADELAANTEGFVVGHEIKLVDADERVVAPGEEGEILTRGPELMVGYAASDQNADAFDRDGYFRTGDLARMTPEGCLVITGRKKDLIIRGGENLSPKEIEDVLHAHAAVREAAVVAMPHPRLGETCCAIVTLQPGARFDTAEMIRTLEAAGLARQKYPERLEIIDELPYTAAGKIRKNILRDRIAAKIQDEGAADAASG